MVFQRFAGCVLRGPEADLPAHNTKFTDYTYESNEGNKYYNNGTAWVLLQGAEKPETLKNKILDFDNNTVQGVLRDPFSMNKRFGYIIPAITPDASLNLALKGMPAAGGTYSLEFDAVEGYYSRFTSIIAERFGWFSVALPVITRREHAPRLKIRSRLPTLTNVGYWIGFSNTAPQLSGNPFPIGAQFFVVGMSASYNTNFQVVRNDGTGDLGLATSMSFLKGAGASWNTFEIIMSDTDIVAKINSISLSVSVRIPSLTQDLYAMIFCYNADTVTKTLDVAKGYFESDIV